MNQSEILESFRISIDVTEDILKTSWEENTAIEFKKAFKREARK